MRIALSSGVTSSNESTVFESTGWLGLAAGTLGSQLRGVAGPCKHLQRVTGRGRFCSGFGGEAHRPGQGVWCQGGWLAEAGTGLGKGAGVLLSDTCKPSYEPPAHSASSHHGHRRPGTVGWGQDLFTVNSLGLGSPGAGPLGRTLRWSVCRTGPHSLDENSCSAIWVGSSATGRCIQMVTGVLNLQGPICSVSSY